MDIPEHSHCQICGKPITMGEEICTKASCVEAREEAQRIKKRSVYLMVALIAAAVLLAKLL